VSITAFGQVFIIVNSTQVAYDLLSKKSIIHSGRPVLQFCGDMCGWKEMMGFLQNTERLRRYRKWFHQFIGPSAVQKFLPIVEQETHKFIRRVLLKPQELDAHIRQ
jgi:cytochrome P450